MKRFLPILLLSLFSVSQAQDVGTLREAFAKHGITITDNFLIVGVSKNDCQYHTVDLGKVYHYLQGAKPSNVVFLTDNIPDFNHYIQNKFGITPNPNISVVNDDKIYGLFYSIPLSFFAYVEKDKVKKDHIGTFFFHADKIEERYTIAISDMIDITYIPGFAAWETIYMDDHILIFDYAEQHIAVLDKTTGDVVSSALSRAISLPDSVKRKLAQSEENYLLSTEMKKRREYLSMGLSEVSVSGVQSNGKDVQLFLWYNYFEIDKNDTAITKEPIVAIANTSLQIQKFVWLDFDTEFTPNHHITMLFKGEMLTKDKFYGYNMSTPKKKRLHGFTILERKGDRVTDRLINQYPLSESISKKDYKGHLDLTCNFDLSATGIYAFHSHFPIVYQFGQNGIQETKLETDIFDGGKKMKIVNDFFILDVKQDDAGRYFMSYRNNVLDKYFVSYHSSNGKEAGLYEIPATPQVNFSGNMEEIKGEFWSQFFDKSNNTNYAIKYVMW